MPSAGEPIDVVMASAQPKPDFDREWARLGSNQRPLACEASALPLSYAPEGVTLPKKRRSPGLPRPRGQPQASEISGDRCCGVTLRRWCEPTYDRGRLV